MATPFVGDKCVRLSCSRHIVCVDNMLYVIRGNERCQSTESYRVDDYGENVSFELCGFV